MSTATTYEGYCPDDYDYLGDYEDSLCLCWKCAHFVEHNIPGTDEYGNPFDGYCAVKLAAAIDAGTTADVETFATMDDWWCNDNFLRRPIQR